MLRQRFGGLVATSLTLLCLLGAAAIGVLAPRSPHPRLSAVGTNASFATEWSDLHPGSPVGSSPPAPGAPTGGLRLRASSRPTALPAVASAPSLTSTQPAESFVASPGPALPVAGEATAYGCAAALAYLYAYAAPGFSFQCPGDAYGHQAATMCVSMSSPCDVARLIVIADPCPAAYMNEASNSWTMSGVSDAPIDPYGSCA